MKKHLLIIGFILLSLLQTHAYENFNFHVLDVKAGITDNYIQDILHDDYGFMWFATRTGLNRYDGYYFKLYTITQLGALIYIISLKIQRVNAIALHLEVL